MRSDMGRVDRRQPMRPRARAAGFSLVELMIAITITLIVSGAIYGLLASGSNAFRREPEVADRQQNARVAMDLIARDVFNAGSALPAFSQAFTVRDPAGIGDCGDGLDGCGTTFGIMSADKPDVLELLSADEQCPFQTVCCTSASCPTPGVAGQFVTRERVPACMGLPGLALLTTVSGTPTKDWFVIQPASATATGAQTCQPGGAATNGSLTLGPSLPGWPPLVAPEAPNPAQPPATPAVYVYRARIVRYRIAPSLDPGDAAPALWRSENGVYQTDGSLGVAPEPGTAGFPGASSPWQVVARGIEDLQIQYFAGAAGPWADAPPVVTSGTYDSLVRQVRIRLSARAAAANLSGEQNVAAGGTGPRAVRGQLSTVVTPRAAFDELQMGGQIR
jgi:prepilin-type N-terminal cleavage/methylation domain-containing protein